MNRPLDHRTGEPQTDEQIASAVEYLKQAVVVDDDRGSECLQTPWSREPHVPENARRVLLWLLERAEPTERTTQPSKSEARLDRQIVERIANVRSGDHVRLRRPAVPGTIRMRLEELRPGKGHLDLVTRGTDLVIKDEPSRVLGSVNHSHGAVPTAVFRLNIPHPRVTVTYEAVFRNDTANQDAP